MAIVYGNALNKYKSYIDYEIVETESQVSVTLSAGMYVTASYGTGGSHWYATLNATDQPSADHDGTSKLGSSTIKTYHPTIENHVFAWQKGSQEEVKTVTYSLRVPNSSLSAGTSTATFDLIVPAGVGKAFVGVNGIAKKITKMYVGVDGIAREISTVYVGVDGIARKA